MEYLAKVYNVGSKIEAHVDVRMCHGDIEAEFATSFAYVDDEIVTLDEVHELIQQALLDEGYQQWTSEVDE